VGGFDAWQAAGGPVEPKEGKPGTPDRSKEDQASQDKSAVDSKKIAEDVSRAQEELKDE
jgi:hypothetical protein